MQQLIIDKRFRVETVVSTPEPNKACWIALHQCYSSGAAIDSKLLTTKDEEWFGNKVIEHALSRGHFSVIQGPSITFNIIGYPHSTIMQYARHRIGTAISVESGRYVGDSIAKLGEYLANRETGEYDKYINDVFYLRPEGNYTDRQGDKYEYTYEWYREDLEVVRLAAIKYWKDRVRGKSEEHSRGLIPYDSRQNMVMSFNLHSLMHAITLRSPADSQLESQTLAASLMDEFELWNPTLGSWYRKKYYGKNKFAP